MAWQAGGYAIGVDLGTSNIVAVLRWPDGRTRPLLFDGQPIMPAGVYLDEQGRLHVGRDAARLAQTDPGRYEPNPKRRVDEPAVLLGDREVPTVDLLGALLRAVAQAAVEAVGFLPPAVLTYPASWGVRRREVLATAVSRAGWPPADPTTTPSGAAGAFGGTVLVPEPVAAARYFADVLRRPVPVGAAIAVYDFGGGTLDIALVRNEGVDRTGRARFAVIGSGGLAELGGLDLDAAIVEHLGALIAATDPQARQRLILPETTAQWRDRRRFWDDVRGAKEMLSRATVAPIAVPGVEQALHLTRDELERLGTPLLRRGVAEAASVITQAGLVPHQLAGLFLVGGSSRVPLVARLLHAELGVAPTVLEQPELPVAEGSLAELAVLAGSPPAGVGAPRVGVPPSAPAGVPPVSPGGVPPVPPSAAPPASGLRGLVRRRSVWIGAGAALALVGVVAAAVLYFTRNSYAEIAFQPFSEIGAVQTGDEQPTRMSTALVGDRAYLAYERDDDRLQVIATEVGSAKELWKYETSSTANQWVGIYAVRDKGIGILAAESSDKKPRDLIVIDPTSKGRELWKRSVTGNDSIFFYEEVVVIADRTTHQLVGLNLRTGKQTWATDLPKDSRGESDVSVYRVTTTEMLGGPSHAAAGTHDPYHGDEQRLVQIGGDRQVTVIDAKSGAKLKSRPNVADVDDYVVAHDGRLFVAPKDGGYRLVSYDLASMGEPTSLYTAPNKEHTAKALVACGQDRVCLLERKGYEAANTELVAVSADKDVQPWRKPAPSAETILSVGEHIITRTAGLPVKTTVFKPDGGQLLSREGRSVRVDGGNLLHFAENLSDYPDNVTVAGLPVGSGDKPIELGQLTEVRSSSCSWNTSVIVCGAKAKFVFVRFADA
ncbi:Hsp70 family protein [Micromonospora sp. NPDC003197]